MELNKFPKPYRLADRAISQLNRQTVLRFDRARQTLMLDKFDELSVFRTMDSLYKSLKNDNERKFRELYCARYRELFLFLKRSWPDDDAVDDLVEIYLAKLLTEPNSLTHYAYDAECLRKRDRAVEAVNAVQNASDKDEEFQKAMRYWSRQTGFYVDIIADAAALQAMKDCGVQKVMWHTQKDEKVCDDCEPLDGKIFDINHVPEKQHLHCRCWLEPVDYRMESIRP